MKINFKNRWWWAAIIAFSLYLFHFAFRSPLNNYQRPIIGDSMAYYAYLPAIFIYDDPSYGFLDANIDKHYFEGAKKQFLVRLPNGEKVNKTYPGVALLYLPFFLIAHFLAMLFGDPDGFSIIYQILFEISHFFYVFVGLGFMLKVLELKGFGEKISLGAVLILILTTNYFYYIDMDLSLIHIHSMALVNAALYLILKWEKEGYQTRWTLPLLSALFGLAIITRPTDVFILILLFVFLEKRKQLIKEIFMVQWKNTLVSFFILFSVILIPSMLWLWQAGVPYAYSYGEEGFHFSSPETFNFLFSYNNGWMVYTPILFLLLPIGIWQQFKKSRVEAIWTLIFYAVTLFIFSSWWCWYYGCSFGQRTMVDFYVLLAYLIALILENIKVQWFRITMVPVIAFTGLLNIHQSYQNFNGYIGCGLRTSEMYWDNFLHFKKQSRVYLTEEEEIVATKQFSMDHEDDEVTGVTKTSEEAQSGEVLTFTSKDYQFSATINTTFHVIYQADYLIVSCFVQQKSSIDQTSLVVEQPEVEGSYQQYWLRDYTVKDEWVKVEFRYYLKDPESPVRVYFWNGNTNEENWFDEIVISVVKQSE